MSTAPRPATTLLQEYLPDYDLVITEGVVVECDPAEVYAAAAGLDFLTVRSPLLSAAMFVRGVPERLRGRKPQPPTQMRLTTSDGRLALPGWLLLGRRPGGEIAFGAVGTFWSATIQWRDVPLTQYEDFSEPGWGKIACHLRVQPAGPGRSVLTYECRTATTDTAARRKMARYWRVIRPFVAHIMRATLRTIAANSSNHAGNTRPTATRRLDRERAAPN